MILFRLAKGKHRLAQLNKTAKLANRNLCKFFELRILPKWVTLLQQPYCNYVSRFWSWCYAEKFHKWLKRTEKLENLAS